MTDENKEKINNKTWWKSCWIMRNQTFFTKSKILEKAAKPNLQTCKFF